MDKYKISIWEDVDNGSTLLEQKVAEIGSNTMIAQHRALDPVLTENANGTHTLTFKMYYRYIDTVTGEEVDNPFISLMVNERKVKLFWKDKWYDFVIKDVTKDSSTKTLNFSCQDLYINELSKNGFNLEFDTELENNMGTIDELAEKVLTGTDWNLGQCDTLVQYQEEPLYEVHYNSAFTATPDRGGAQVTISANANIYVFHSCYNTNKIQFLYGTTNLSTVEGSNVIIDKYQSDDSNWDCYTAEVTPNTGNLTQYRGRRVVENVKQIYDSRLKKYVDVYTLGTEKVYIDRTSKIETPQTISNLILNAEHFTTVAGWHVLDQEFIGTSTSGTAICTPVIVQQYYPTYSTVSTEYEGDGYLRVVLSPSNSSYEGPYTTTDSVTIFNDAFNGNIVRLPREGIQNGQRYILRTEVYTDDSGKPSTTKITNFFSGSVYKNFGSSSATEITNAFVKDVSTSLSGAAVWTANTSFSIEEIDNNIISLQFKMPQTSWVKKVEFFPYVESGETYIEPNNFVTEAVVREIYNVYSPSEAEKDPLERTYIGQYEGAIPSNFNPTYEDEKVRFINVKESNRFNLLLTLAETFNCWAIFSIDHDETGAIIPNSKTVTFKERLGEDTGLGFVYGIDLRTVSRNLNSINIVTKTIVKQNANEFGEDGFCTIARAPENYSKENFILDFTYFINQGLLDGNKINRDLYNSTDALFVEDEGGYFYLLNRYNTEYDETIEDLTFSKQILTQYESLLTVKQEQVKALTQQIESQRNRLCQIMGVTTWDSIDWTKQDIADYSTFMNGAAAESIMSAQKAEVEGEITNLQAYVDELKTHIDELEVTQKELVDKKNALNEAFFKKYGAYLQEGTWNSEDYYDDSRYYLDACDVASTSAEPQVSYNISVLRLQALEEFKAKVFHIGDTVFIEDPEFFGYEWIDGIKTPIRKKVIVNQIVSHLENPTQDAITIQNYKTDFEDLFQRITASTQSLQYSSGEYNRAAGLVSSTGGITGDALQTSLAANNNLVYQVLNNSITQDPTGITLIDLTNPNNRVKITANGLYISDDGGATWKNAIRGSGVATEYLSAGNITTNNIAIYDGEWPTFRWDKDGISAYRFDGNNKYYNTFVRYDQYGIYGIENGLDFTPIDEDDVWDNAKFALTWRGFMLKNTYTDGGQVSITSDNDFQVIDAEDNERIKIGKIGEEAGHNIYGMKITNNEGEDVFWTDSNGNVYVNTSIYINNGDITIGLNNTINRMAEETTTLLPNKTYYSKIAEEGEDQSEYEVEIDYTLQYYTRTETEPYEYKEVSDNTRLKGNVAYYTRTGTEGSYEYTLTISPPLYRQMDSVFNANQNFVVYEDGYVNATNAKIEGVIQSSEGIFGNNAVVITSQGLKAGEVLLSQNGISVPLGNEGDITINENGISVGTVFSVDSLGNSSFSGNVNASTLTVQSGTIGGFIIENNSLKSSDENSGLILNGADGSIIAKKITIGNEAKIDDYIKLSDDAYILNPDKYSNIALALGEIGGDIEEVINAKIKLTTDGILNLGSLILDGKNSIMYDTAKTWYIAEGEASFNNVNIRGTLETAIFKPTSIQTAAGVMIFRPSSKFEKIADKVISNLEIELSIGDYLVLGSTNGNNTDFTKYVKVVDANDGTYELDKSVGNSDYCILMAHYQSSTFSNDLLIGVNSTNTSASGLYPQGITFIKPNSVTNDNNLSYNTPSMFLGDLTQINVPNVTGYGLYGDNVYLHGSLTTEYIQNQSIKYAGINTISNVSFNKNGDADTSPIIFWAGSDSAEAIDIKNSKFQVSSNGTIYAQGALIQGIITGSDIYTSAIHGTSINPALKVYTEGKAGGIEFYKIKPDSNPEEAIVSFTIDDDGFKDRDADPFIKIEYPTYKESADISFIGSQFVTNSNLKITNQQIALQNNSDINYNSSILEFSQNGLSWSSQAKQILNMTNDSVDIKATTNIESNLKLSGNYRMEYKNENNGYNLYILS